MQRERRMKRMDFFQLKGQMDKFMTENAVRDRD